MYIKSIYSLGLYNTLIAPRQKVKPLAHKRMPEDGILVAEQSVTWQLQGYRDLNSTTWAYIGPDGLNVAKAKEQ